jgi:hypothetical protein
MILLYWFLIATCAGVDLDLAWHHDGIRLAGCSLALLAFLAVRRDLTDEKTL